MELRQGRGVMACVEYQDTRIPPLPATIGMQQCVILKLPLTVCNSRLPSAVVQS